MLAIAKELDSEQALMQIAGQMAVFVEPGTVIYLQGMLGAGKTTFTRGFLRGLGYEDKVKSPSYTLVEPYEIGAALIYHFDLYRVQSSDELAQRGINDYFTAQAICLIEWPEHGHPLLPAADLHVALTVTESGRSLKVTAQTERGERCLAKFNNE